MITVGVTQQTIQGIASSSGTLATSGNVADTTVTAISKNIATPTDQTSSQQIRMCDYNVYILCLYTSANNIRICTGSTMYLIFRVTCAVMQLH